MLFTNQSFANDNKRFQLKPGDIIVTKGPVFKWFLVTVVWQLIMTLYFKLKVQDKPMTEDFESYRDRYGKGKMNG